ncbi:RNA methylase [Rhizoctonia solani AG-1 IA]|uniref:RNA methylase n=1 Tax=Thanatephorus cucumeris (strain AG1-IA) TaxID=983506 RepID=L8WX84_THACA|nr:RNA methylase [Rhizoctonia solani AG-1 IA]
MPKPYFIHFAVTHADFRIPELLSVAQCYGFEVGLPSEPEIDNNRPFLQLEINNDEDAKVLAQRCILVKAVYALWGHGESYDELHAMNKRNRAIWDTDHYNSARFRFNVMAYSHTLSKERQRDIMNSFAYMGYQISRLPLDETHITDPDSRGWPRHKRQVDGEFRQIAEGTARKLIATFDVKKRSYYGNTSMEAEVSLLMANQTLAAPGKLIYDPFVGTDTTPEIRKAATQYGVLPRVLDLCTFDVTQGPLRRGGLFDAIVTDPISDIDGVRAGAKRLGRKDGQEMRTEPLILQDGSLSHTHKTYVPPTKPYELSALASDLVELARYLLVPGGRLVFFLPTVTDDYAPVDIPNCEEEYTAPTFGLEQYVNEHVPAHKNFRDKYFKGFRKGDEVDTALAIVNLVKFNQTPDRLPYMNRPNSSVCTDKLNLRSLGNKLPVAINAWAVTSRRDGASISAKRPHYVSKLLVHLNHCVPWNRRSSFHVRDCCENIRGPIVGDN